MYLHSIGHTDANALEVWLWILLAQPGGLAKSVVRVFLLRMSEELASASCRCVFPSGAATPKIWLLRQGLIVSCLRREPTLSQVPLPKG